MKVLLDTNAVLDLMLECEPWRGEAEAVAQADAEGRIRSYVCASAITDIYYISGKLVGPDRHIRRIFESDLPSASTIA